MTNPILHDERVPEIAAQVFELTNDDLSAAIEVAALVAGLVFTTAIRAKADRPAFDAFSARIWQRVSEIRLAAQEKKNGGAK